MEIENGIWKYNEIEPKPWEKNEWGWIMTMSTEPIATREELFVITLSIFEF
jgi:hypothetical protein